MSQMEEMKKFMNKNTEEMMPKGKGKNLFKIVPMGMNDEEE